MQSLNDNQLRLICPRLASARRTELLPHLNTAMARFGIDTKFRIAAFVSNLMHESGSFHYSREIWGPTPQQRKYEPGTKLARDLGNVVPGDGKRYMGRGFIQTTGRANYTRVGDALGLPLIANPELLELPPNAMASAAFFWSDKRLNKLADCLRGRRDSNEQKTLTAICERINGGHNGLAERIANYWRCLAVLDETPAAVAAHEKLEQKVASNPVIPTPETHTPAEIAEVQQTPVLADMAAKAEVAEQGKAAGIIDLAESVPASALKATATSLWSRTGGKVIQLLGVAYAALQAGSVVAWGGVAVIAIALALLAWHNRADLKRWKALLFSKGKEMAIGA